MSDFFKSSHLQGFEPTTSVVPKWCATNWTIQDWIKYEMDTCLAGWLAIFCDPAVNGKSISSHYQARVKLEFFNERKRKRENPPKVHFQAQPQPAIKSYFCWVNSPKNSF